MRPLKRHTDDSMSYLSGYFDHPSVGVFVFLRGVKKA